MQELDSYSLEHPETLIGSSTEFFNDEVNKPRSTQQTANTIASIKNTIDPDRSMAEHLEDASISLETGDQITAIDGVTAEYHEYYRDLFRSVLDENLVTSNLEEVADTVEDIKTVFSDTDDVLSQVDKLEHAQILSLTGKSDRNLAERQYYERKVGELTEGTSIMEDIVNIGGMFWPDVHFDAADLTGSSTFDAEESVKQYIDRFQSMDQAERLKVFPNMVKDVLAASDGNEIKAANRLFQIIDPTKAEEVEVEFALDTFDWATIVAPIVNGVFKSARTMNTISKIKNSSKAKETVVEGGKVKVVEEEVIDEELINAEILERKANLLPLAGNRLDRKTRKGLSVQRKDLEHKINTLKSATKKKDKRGKKQAIANLEEKLDRVKSLEKADERAQAANTELSRIEKAEREAKTVEEKAKLILKEVPTVKQTRTVADEQAAQLNAASLVDETEEVANSLGTDRITAAANTSPFNYSDHGMVGATDDIAADTNKVLDEVKKIRGQVQEHLAPTLGHRNYLKETALTKGEQELVQQKNLGSVEELAEEYHNATGKYLTEARITNKTEEGFTVSYKLDGVDESRDVAYNINDVGDLDILEAGQVETKIWSPSVWMDRIQKDAVEVATRIGFAQTRVLKDLEDAVNMATKHLGSSLSISGRASRKRVDSVLVAGDELAAGKGTVFNIQQLKYEGIPTDQGLVKLNDGEVASYYAMRDVFDALHFVKNKQVRDTLVFNNFKEVTIGGQADGAIFKQSIAKEITPGQLPAKALETDSFRIWNTSGDGFQGSVVKLNSLDLDTNLEEGFKLVKFKEAEKVGDEFVEYGLVKSDQIQELRGQVLNKKVGYVPKQSKDGFYFVKQAVSKTLNGTKKSAAGTRTLRMFDNRADATAYSDSLKANDIENASSYGVRHDREMSMAELEDDIINESGGLFTSSRSSREITYGLDGNKPRRISALEAMERNLQHISNNVPMNEFRMGIQQRWLNSARPYLTDPSDFNSPLKEALLDVDVKKEVALRESREWIRDQMRIPTPSERRWEAFTRRSAEWMEGKPLLDRPGSNISIRRGVMHVGAKDPYAAMRGSAFHALLGWFNPAQLWVQAQGASIAFALDPLAAPQRMREYMALRAGLTLRGNTEALRRTAKAAGVDADEFEELVEQFHKTGLMDSVKSTADYNAASQSYWIGADALSRAADKGLVFFREGERFTRGYAFLTARSSWIKDNPGKIIDDSATKEIVTRTVKKMLNLNRANRAHWQKGLLSVPTQFQQITTKFVENMLPDIMPGSAKKFTGGEKARIMVAQMALYGTAGVPMSEWLMNEAAQSFGMGPEDLSPEQVAALSNGFWGWLGKEVTGESIEFGPRGGVASGIETVIKDLFINNQPFSKAALGAFGTVPERGIRAIGTIAPMVANLDELEWTAAEFKKALFSVTDIVSTFNNYHQGQMWADNQEVRDRRGNLLFSIDADEDAALVWTKKLGFTPSRVADIYNLKNYDRQQKEMVREKASALRALWVNYTANTNITEEDKTNLAFREKFILGKNPMVAEKAREMAAKNLWSGESVEDKSTLKAIRGWIEYDDLTAGTEGLLLNSNLQKGKE